MDVVPEKPNRPFFYAAFLWCLILLVSSGIGCQLNAQNDIRFQRISVDQGLSQSSIKSIVQDQYGYLWIATLDGLNRYNGREFKIYRHDKANKNSLYSNQLVQLYLDSEQNLWLIYRDAIARYEPKTDSFTNYRITLPDSKKTLIIQGMNNLHNDIVLLITNQGLLRFNIATNEVSKSTQHAQFDGHRITSNFYLSGVGEWVITQFEAFVKFDNSSEWTSVFYDPINITGYFSEATGEVYLQTKQHLLKFSAVDKKIHVVDRFTEKDNFDINQNSIVKLSTGELWVNRGLLYVYNEKDAFKTVIRNIPQNPTSLSGDMVACVYETKDNVVWVGTNGFGLNKYDPQLSIFSHIGTYHGAPLTLSHNYVNTIYTSDDNQLFIGTFNGFDVLNLQNRQSRHFSILNSDMLPTRINKIIQDTRKNNWLLTNSKGLMRFDGNRILPSGIQALDSANLNIFGAVETGNGNYVLATGNGLYKWNPERGTSAKMNAMGSMAIGLFKNELWIESEFEVSVLDITGKNVVRSFKKNSYTSSSFPQAPIKCFYTDTDDQLWIGSWGGGLTVYDAASQQFKSYTEADGLPNSVVYGILEDAHGNLWLSTNKGICVFDKKNRKVVRNFNKDDGLQGDEFNTNAYFKSPSGKFYFGGINGLTYFNSNEAIQINSTIPKSILTGFFINQIRTDNLKNGEVINQYGDQDIVLDWNERNFGFEVASLGFTYPGRTRFKYILENFDQTWNVVDTETRLSFTNIPPGNYTLRVLSSNSFGDWETTGLRIGIVVKGPFWKDPLFIFFVVVVCIVSVVVSYFWRITALKRRAHYLQSLVDERTREIQIKNEEIQAQNEELITQSETVGKQNEELIQIRTSLEHKVEERTKVLKNLNKHLIEQNTQLEQFAFITAHNIRGPLARIKGLLNLLPKDASKEMSYLDLSVQNLDEVISDLSKIINIRHGVDQLMESVPLKTMLTQVIQALEEDIEKKQATIDIDEFEDIVINGIKPYLYSILYNLLHNALKYSTSVRQPYIKCSAKKVDSKIVVSIEDNGLGIDMHYASKKIFGLYQRFHINIAGKGLGLFLIKTQTEAMGGEITVSSELNHGTSFTLVFKDR